MKDQSAKLTLIEALSSGKSVSGEVLGAKLGVSRAAISKQIKSLEEWGIDVFSIPGKGYQMSRPIELLDQALLQQQIDSPIDIDLHHQIDSTNQHMMTQLHKWSSGDLCLAEYQSAGRGRRGKSWISPFGSNLYMSMYWRFEQGVAATMGLSLVVGLAIADTLNSLGVQSTLKWPNDVYIESKKVAGVLVELAIEAGGAAQVVIGIGLNMTMSDTTSGIDQPWTNLEEHLSTPLARNQFTAQLVNRLHQELNEYQVNGNANLARRWAEYDHFIDQPVVLLMGNQSIEGTCKGIDQSGALLIEQQGEVKSYIGGEISVRGRS